MKQESWTARSNKNNIKIDMKSWALEQIAISINKN